MTDLLVRGGTVVTATGSAARRRRRHGRPDRGRRARTSRRTSARRGRRRDRPARPARRGRRPHPYPRRDRRRARPLLPGFRGGGVRRHDDVPGVQQPGHRLVAGGRAVARGRPARVARARPSPTARSTTRRVSPSRARMDDPVAELPAIVDAGRADRQGVHGLRLPARRPPPVRRDAGHGRAGRDAPGPLRGPRPHRRRGRRGASAAARPRHGSTPPRAHRRPRPSRPIGRWRSRGQTGAPVHVVHLSSAAALEEVRRAKAAGVRAHAETCPHYLVLDESRYEQPDEDVRPVRHLAAAPLPRRRRGLWAGLADGTLDLVATDHVPDRLAVEKADAAAASPFDKISNGAPGHRDPARPSVYSRGRRDAAGSRSSGWSTCSRPRRLACSARPEGRDRSGPGRRPRPVRPVSAADPDRAATSTTRATTRRTRASRSTAPSGRSSSAAARSSGTAASSANAATARSWRGGSPADARRARADGAPGRSPS